MESLNVAWSRRIPREASIHLVGGGTFGYAIFGDGRFLRFPDGAEGMVCVGVGYACLGRFLVVLGASLRVIVFDTSFEMIFDEFEAPTGTKRIVVSAGTIACQGDDWVSRRDVTGLVEPTAADMLGAEPVLQGSEASGREDAPIDRVRRGCVIDAAEVLAALDSGNFDMARILVFALSRPEDLATVLVRALCIPGQEMVLPLLKWARDLRAEIAPRLAGDVMEALLVFLAGFLRDDLPLVLDWSEEVLKLGGVLIRHQSRLSAFSSALQEELNRLERASLALAALDPVKVAEPRFSYSVTTMEFTWPDQTAAVDSKPRRRKQRSAAGCPQES